MQEKNRITKVYCIIYYLEKIIIATKKYRNSYIQQDRF